MVANDSLRIVASMPAFKFGPKALLALKFEDFKFSAPPCWKIDFAKSKQFARWLTFWPFSHPKVPDLKLKKGLYLGDTSQVLLASIEADKKSRVEESST